MGYETVEGKLMCQAEHLVLQFKEKDRAFRKNPLLTVAFDYQEVESLEWISRWFQPKRIIFRTTAASKLDDFPGANVGKAELFVCKESYPQAKKLPSLVDYRKSEARLAASDSRLQNRSEGP